MPNNWKTYKLSEVTKLTTGFAFKSKDYENNGTLKVIRGINVTEGKLRWADDSRFWNHSVKDYTKYQIELDDIVIGMDGSKIGKNRAIVRENDLPSILAQRVARIQSIPKISYQKYIWQLINNSQFENYINNIQTGTSIPHISLGQIGNFEIKLPSIDEQQSIATILSAIDDKIENNLAINKTLEEMAMALYKHWFVDFGPFKDGEFVESELGLIPKGWEVKRLEKLVDVGSSKRIFYNEYVEEGIPFYRGKEVIELSKGKSISSELFISNEKFEEIKSKFEVPKKGDILISSVGTIGVSWLVDGFEDFYFKDGNLTWLKNYKTFLKGEYFHLWLNSENGKNQIDGEVIGSTQKALTISSLRNFKILFPNENVYEKIGDEFVNYSEQKQLNLIEIKTLTQLRDTLLPKLISGEVRLKEFREKVV